MNPQYASANRTTPMTVTESNPNMMAFKKMPTTKTVEGTVGVLSPRRELQLSSSLKPKKSFSSASGLPVFITRVKNKDNHAIKLEMAKTDIVDPYHNPQVHVFRDNAAPYNKPIFVVAFLIVCLICRKAGKI